MGRPKKKIFLNDIEFRAATVDWQDAASALSLPVEYLTPDRVVEFNPIQHAKGYVAKLGDYLVVVNQICGTDADCTVIPLKPEVKINYD